MPRLVQLNESCSMDLFGNHFYTMEEKQSSPLAEMAENRAMEPFLRAINGL